MADGQAEAAWEAHYKRIYPTSVFTPEYMAGAYRPAFIQGKKAGFHCGWEEATEAAAEMASFEHMEAVAKFSALREAARKVATAYARVGTNEDGSLGALYLRCAKLADVLEAAP